jgi:hypothetical protein
LGAIYDSMDQLGDAENSYRAAKDIEERIVQASPSNSGARLDLSFTYADLGGVLWALGRRSEGSGFSRKGLDLRAEEVAADPNNVRAKIALATSHHRLGDQVESTGDRSGALRNYQNAAHLWIQLANGGHLGDESRSRQALTEYRMAGTLVALHRNADAEPHRRRAYDIWAPLAQGRALNAEQQRFFSELQAQYR